MPSWCLVLLSVWSWLSQCELKAHWLPPKTCLRAKSRVSTAGPHIYSSLMAQGPLQRLSHLTCTMVLTSTGAPHEPAAQAGGDTVLTIGGQGVGVHSQLTCPLPRFTPEHQLIRKSKVSRFPGDPSAEHTAPWGPPGRSLSVTKPWAWAHPISVLGQRNGVRLG